MIILEILFAITLTCVYIWQLYNAYRTENRIPAEHVIGYGITVFIVLAYGLTYDDVQSVLLVHSVFTGVWITQYIAESIYKKKAHQ